MIPFALVLSVIVVAGFVGSFLVITLLAFQRYHEHGEQVIYLVGLTACPVCHRRFS
jgi:hypothetical protein